MSNQILEIVFFCPNEFGEMTTYHVQQDWCNYPVRSISFINQSISANQMLSEVTVAYGANLEDVFPNAVITRITYER